MELEKVKQDVFKALELAGLKGEISLEEIEKELIKEDTAFHSLLLLGILRRLLFQENEPAMELFLPAITGWKNYLPHKKLNGVSPLEHIEKYPPGEYEKLFISGLMEEYQKRLKANSQNNADQFNVEEDFNDFQKEYLNRLPAKQLFGNFGSGFMTIREIIIEERRQNGRPEKDIEKIGLKIFVENTAEGLGWKAAEIDDRYINAIEKLKAMQENPRLRNANSIHSIKKQLEKDEAYHRAGPAPHQFYLNYAAAVFLDGGSRKIVRCLLDRSLYFCPDYAPALKMRESFS